MWCQGRVSPGSVCAQPIARSSVGLWAWPARLYPVPAAARFCSNSGQTVDPWSSAYYRRLCSSGAHPNYTWVLTSVPGFLCVSVKQLKHGQRGVVRQIHWEFTHGEDFPWVTSVGVRPLSLTSDQTFPLSDTRLMLPFILLAGYLWRGTPVRSHANLGVTGGPEYTVNVDFTDLDSRKRLA